MYINSIYSDPNMKKSKEEIKAELLKQLEELDKPPAPVDNLDIINAKLDSINSKIIITFIAAVICLALLIGIVGWIMIA